MRWKLSDSRRLGPHKAGSVVFVLAVFVLLAGSYLLAAEEKADSRPVRYRVFSLRHIPADKGKEYLAQFKIGTVSQLPGANTLLVTASPRQLIKASAIMKFVDAEEEFVIKQIPAALLAQDLPSNKQIAAEVGDISIGTFFEPPTGPAERRAIIDVHDGVVVVVAPAKRLEKIVSAIGLLQEPKADVRQPAEGGKAVEPNQTEQYEGEIVSQVLPEEIIIVPSDLVGFSDANQTRENELFSRLLESLAEAERRAAEPNQQVSRPNEPNVVVIVAEPNEPNIVVTVARPNEPSVVVVLPEVNVPSEPSAEQLKEAALAAILKRLEALEAKVKPEPAPEEVTVEIAQPNEVNEVAEPNKVAEPVPEVQYEPEPIPGGNDILKLNLPQTLPITEFLGFMGENLHLDYLYDPKKVVGSVTLRLHGKLRGDIKRKDLYPLLESVLQFNGFVMTRKGNLVLIVPVAEADRIDAPIVRPDKDRPEYGDVIVTRVFKLKHIDTATAQKLLTSMQLGLTIREIPETGTLMVTGYSYRMARIEEVLDVVDRPGEPKQFKFRQLKYTMAKTLAPKVKNLAEQLGTISVTVAAGAPSRAALKRKPGESAAAFRARQAQARRSGAKPTAARARVAKPTVYLDADERTNRILMIGLDKQLDIVSKLIDSLDVEQQDLRTMRLYEIQNVDAEEVRNKLTELGIIGAARTTPRRPTGRATPSAKGKGPAAVTPTRSEEALVEEPQVVIIEATNSLLVNATAEQHARIALIIGYVDAETLDITIPYVIYSLENQDPVDLSDVLNQLIRETITGKDAKGAKIERTEKRIEEDIIIIADPQTYSLIVYASKKNQQWISSLIKKLDEYRPQVLLDVTLVEISKNDDFNFDLNIIQSFPDLINTSGLTGSIVEGITSTGIITALDSKGMDRFIDLQSDKGSGTAFYGDRHINALLTAMQTKGYGRVLARPKLLVNDNQEGTITTKNTTYVTKITHNWTTGDNPVQTEDKTYHPYDDGVTLTISPHISKGDNLRLEITMQRSDFDAKTLGGDKPPDLSSSEITTVVTVPDESTIILGGLEKIKQSKGGVKVPFFGDIPLVGVLFRKTENKDEQIRLYVFVKAHILRPGKEFEGLSDIEVVSEKNRATFERYEREMQEYEDWPGIKPGMMDPLRVLEAD